MYKFASYLFFALHFFLPSLSALNLMDIAAPANDPVIEKRHLTRYVGTIFQSRKDYVEEKLRHIDEDTTSFEFIRFPSGGSIRVAGEGASQLREFYIGAYTDQLKFIKDDPFTVKSGTGGNKKLKIDTLTGLTTFFAAMAHTFCNFYKISCDYRASLQKMSETYQTLRKPFLLDEDSMLGDFATIIRAVRPHLPKANELKTLPKIKALLEEGNGNIKTIAMFAAHQQGLPFNPTLQPPSPSLPTKSLMAAAAATPPAEAARNSHPPSLAAGATKAPEHTEPRPKPLAVAAPAAHPAEAARECHPPSLAPEGRDPGHVKVKTRPDPQKPNLNALFSEKPAWKAAQEKLKEEKPTDAQPRPTKALKGTHRRVLEKILYGNLGALNVDKTLSLLAHLGFIEGTASQHISLRTQAIELWLDGTRALIDPTPIQTLATAHTSRGKPYFKPYVAERLRKALLAAGFGNLFPERAKK